MSINRSLSAIAAAATVVAGVLAVTPAFAGWGGGAVPSTAAASMLSQNSEFGSLITPPTMPQVALFGTPYPYGF